MLDQSPNLYQLIHHLPKVKCYIPPNVIETDILGRSRAADLAKLMLLYYWIEMGPIYKRAITVLRPLTPPFILLTIAIGGLLTEK